MKASRATVKLVKSHGDLVKLVFAIAEKLDIDPSEVLGGVTEAEVIAEETPEEGKKRKKKSGSDTGSE